MRNDDGLETTRPKTTASCFLVTCLSGALSSRQRINHHTVQGSPLNLLFPQLAYCNNWWEWQPEWGPRTTAWVRGYCRPAGSAGKSPERRRRYPVQCAGSSGLSKQSQQDKSGGSLRGCPKDAPWVLFLQSGSGREMKDV